MSVPKGTKPSTHSDLTLFMLLRLLLCVLPYLAFRPPSQISLVYLELLLVAQYTFQVAVHCLCHRGPATVTGGSGGRVHEVYGVCSGAMADPAVQWWLGAIGLHVSS